MINYEDLLKRFISAACQAEGVSPDYFTDDFRVDVEFTDEELDEIRRLDKAGQND